MVHKMEYYAFKNESYLVYVYQFFQIASKLLGHRYI